MKRNLIAIVTVLVLMLWAVSGCASLSALQPRGECLLELARPEIALKLDASRDASTRVIEAARAGAPIDERDVAAMREGGRILEAASRCLR